MQKKNYIKGSIKILIEGKTIAIKGKLDYFDYEEVNKFLMDTSTHLEVDILVIDFRYATYISSKGIKLFANFLHKAKKPVKLILDGSLEWQIRGIEPLRKIKPEGMITIEQD